MVEKAKVFEYIKENLESCQVCGSYLQLQISDSSTLLKCCTEWYDDLKTFLSKLGYLTLRLKNHAYVPCVNEACICRNYPDREYFDVIFKREHNYLLTNTVYSKNDQCKNTYLPKPRLLLTNDEVEILKSSDQVVFKTTPSLKNFNLNDEMILIDLTQKRIEWVINYLEDDGDEFIFSIRNVNSNPK